MTDADLESDPRQMTGQDPLTPAERNKPVSLQVLVQGALEVLERTVTVYDTRPHWPLSAAVGWRLFPNPPAINFLCEPLSPNKIDKGASLLRRSKLLGALALRALAIDADADADQELAKKIAAAIHAAWRNLFDELAAGKLTAEGYDPKIERCGPIPPVEFSRFPAYAHRLESRVGRYRNVVIRRAEVLRLWPSPLASVQDEPDRLETVPRLPKAGYEIDDVPLVLKMVRLFESRKCVSPWAAALEVAVDARGGGTVESKAKRLHRRFQRFRSAALKNSEN